MLIFSYLMIGIYRFEATDYFVAVRLAMKPKKSRHRGLPRHERFKIYSKKTTAKS